LSNAYIDEAGGLRVSKLPKICRKDSRRWKSQMNFHPQMNTSLSTSTRNSKTGKPAHLGRRNQLVVKGTDERTEADLMKLRMWCGAVS